MHGAVRVYRMGGLDYGATGDDALITAIVTVPTQCTRMRLQNIGAVVIWLKWNAAAATDDGLKLAVGDTIDLEEQRDDLVLWHAYSASAGVIAALMEY